MKLVTSKTIDAVIDRIDKMDEPHYENWMDALANNQPALVGWLFGDNFNDLSDEERGFLEYVTLILWMSTTEEKGPISPISEDMIGEWEERNCAIMEDAGNATFEEKLNIFFADYAQEDLLSLVEEAITDDDGEEELVVSKESRELVFIALKTVIDVLTFQE